GRLFPAFTGAGVEQVCNGGRGIDRLPGRLTHTDPVEMPMSAHSDPTPDTPSGAPSARRRPVLPLLGIGAIVAVLAAAFAWAAGWVGGGLTAQRMTDSIEANNKQ